MINNIPADIPPAIVKFADEHIKKPFGAKGRHFSYLTALDGNELYAMNWKFSHPHTFAPLIFVYDCKSVHLPNEFERNNINKNDIIPKYYGRYIKQEHLCHRDKKAYNQHTKPSDYDIEVLHISAKYIPKAVIEYADTHFEDSWYPGTDKRIINYITTKNGYEAYVVYWSSKLYHRKSIARPLLYDGQKVRIPDLYEWLDITSNVSNFYRSHGRPYLHNKD